MSAGLSVSGVSHSYGDKRALDDVGFSVARGQFCALLGPNGAGKSTLFGLLTRLFTPRSGTIEIGGTDIAANPREALAKLGVVFQQPTLDLEMSVQGNMTYYAALHGIRGKDAATRIAAALTQLGMAERAHEKVRALNGGHRRRMEIARAMLHDPQVLLLDEPTVGLDPATRHDITRHVHALAAEKNMTVLWATHLVDEVTDNDRLIVMHRGRIIADGIASEIGGTAGVASAFSSLTAETAA